MDIQASSVVNNITCTLLWIMRGCNLVFIKIPTPKFRWCFFLTVVIQMQGFRSQLQDMQSTPSSYLSTPLGVHGIPEKRYWFSGFSCRASNWIFLKSDEIVIMTDWRVCCGIQRIDICYSKRSRTSCSKLATRTSFDFDLIVRLWNPASCFSIKLMDSKHGPCLKFTFLKCTLIQIYLLDYNRKI